MQQLNIDQIRDLDGKLPNLFNTKTIQQKISEKGWACISQEKTLSRSTNPSIYNDIKDKYDNADKDTEPTLTDVLTSINGLRNIIKIGNKYYAIVSENGWNDTYLYKSTDGIVWSKVEAMLIGNNNIGCNLYNANGKLVVMFIGYNSSKRFITVYDTNTDTQITKQEDITPNDDRAKFGFFYNNKFYFYYTDGYVYTVENFDFQNKVSTNSQMLPLAFDGTYFYGSDKIVGVGGNPYGRICKGTSIDSIDTVVIDDNWNDDMIIAITDTRLYRVSGNSLYVVENGIANELVPFEQYVTNVTNVSAYGNTIYYEYYTDFFKMIYTKVSNDGGLTWNNILEDYSGRDKGAYIYCAGEDVFASINYLGKICKCSFSAAKQYTDKYLIDGNEVEIDYAKSQDGTKIITDLTQSSAIASVNSYLGYNNYFQLNTIVGSEGVTLPYNSNLWTMMYIGDNYIETSFPDGRYTHTWSRNITNYNGVENLNTITLNNYTDTKKYFSAPLFAKDFVDAETWEINIQFKYLGRYSDFFTICSFGTVPLSDSVDCQGFSFGLESGNSCLFMSSSGSNWDIVAQGSTPTQFIMTKNKTYDWKIEFTGTQYILSAKENISTTWTTLSTVSSSTKIGTSNNDTENIIFGQNGFSGNVYQLYATFNLQNCNIKLDDEIVWTGAELVSTVTPEMPTRLLPQAESITIDDASVVLDIKGNQNIVLNNTSLTSITIASCEDSQLETTIRFIAGASFAFSYTNAGVKINGSLPTFEEDGEYIILIVNKTIFVSDKIVAGE